MKAKTIFLIDDDTDDIELFSIALNNVDISYNCITTDNAIDGLNKLDSDGAFIPDYIFLDLNMQPMDGFLFLKEIKRLPHLSHIPIIIFTTSSASSDIDKARQLGATHFISKPSSIKKLGELLTLFFSSNQLPFYLNF